MVIKFKNHCLLNLDFTSDMLQREPDSPRRPSPPRAPCAPAVTGMWVPNENTMNSFYSDEELFEEPDPHQGSSTDTLFRNFAAQGQSGPESERPRRGRRPRELRRKDFFFDRRPYDPMVVRGRERHPCPFIRKDCPRTTLRGPVQQVDSWDWDWNLGGCKYRRKFVSGLLGPPKDKWVDVCNFD